MPRLFLVDAFSHGPFTGNPAGVCPLDGPGEEAWMQGVAMEMNQAETAFYWPEGDSFRLRWFTPDGEVDLCGHATLATTHVILNELRLVDPSQTIEFATKSGCLRTNSEGGLISMDFPSEPPQESEMPLTLPGAIWQGKNRMDWVAVFGSASEVRAFRPDLPSIVSAGMRGLLITAPGDEEGVDFISRFFAPQYGIPEDPVTGSAHCCLAPLWAERLGVLEMRGYQASKRGGYVGVKVRGDRVELSGRASTFLRADLA